MSTKRKAQITGTKDKPTPKLVDPPRLRIDPELYRLMVNWVEWRGGGSSYKGYMQYTALASMLRPGGAGAYSDPAFAERLSLPEIASEGEKVERAVLSLSAIHINVIELYWDVNVKGPKGGQAAKAKHLQVRYESYIAAVMIAHEKLRAILVAHPSPATEGKRSN